MKKLIAILLACMVFAGGTVQVFAADHSARGISTSAVSPRMTYISDCKNSLSIDSAGSASIKASIDGYKGVTTKVSMSTVLQQYKNGRWENVKTFSASSNNYYGSLNQKHTVTKGYTYRLSTTFTAYSGSSSEVATETSAEAKY